MSTNRSIGCWADEEDAAALKKRCKVFKFELPVSRHFGEGGPREQDNEIEAPPRYIGPDDLYTAYSRLKGGVEEYVKHRIECVGAISGAEAGGAVYGGPPCPELEATTPEERPFLNSEYRQSRFHFVRSTVSKYYIKSHHDVYLKLPDDEYERLLDLCGDRFEKTISNQILRNEARRFMKQRQNCIWDNLYDTLSDGYKSLSPEERDTDGADWILQLLKANRIDCVEFFAWISLVGNRQLPKINTLVLTGPANTGKSLLLRCLLSNLHAAVITRPGDASASHGQPAWQKCYVLYEEPRVARGTAHDTALLLGGEPLEVSFFRCASEASV